jgi:hypothetical protein
MFNQNHIVTFPKKWGICLSVAVLTLTASKVFSQESLTPIDAQISLLTEKNLQSLDYLVDQILSAENSLVSQDKNCIVNGSLQKEIKVAGDAALISSCHPKNLNSSQVATPQVAAPQVATPQVAAPQAAGSQMGMPRVEVTQGVALQSPTEQISPQGIPVNGNCFPFQGCATEISNSACYPCEMNCFSGCEIGCQQQTGRCAGVFPYLGVTGGRGIGWQRDYTTLGVMFVSGNPFANVQPFVDFKWHYNTDRLSGANAGFGVRLRPDCSGVTFGGNVYYDYRDGCYGDLHQIGVGMEALSRCVEVRVNGYFPIQTESCHTKAIFDDYIGDYFVSFQPCQFPLTGADGEAGLVLFGYKNFRVFVGAGGYYFNNRLNMYAMGARGHLSLRYTDKVGFDIYATTDKLFRNRVWGEFYISLPFSCLSREKRGCNPCCQTPCRPCYRRVYRNDWIVLNNACCWDFNFDDTIGRKECESNSCGCNGCGCK